MVEDAEVARHNLVLQNGTGWNVDAVVVLCDDDDRALVVMEITREEHVNLKQA